MPLSEQEGDRPYKTLLCNPRSPTPRFWAPKPGSLFRGLIEDCSIKVARALPFLQTLPQALLHGYGGLPSGQGPKHWAGIHQDQSESTRSPSILSFPGPTRLLPLLQLPHPAQLKSTVTGALGHYTSYQTLTSSPQWPVWFSLDSSVAWGIMW